MHRALSIKPTARIAALLIGLVVLPACGGGGDPTNNAQEGDGREITMASGDNWFNPNEIQIARGETVTFVISNDGALTHNISIDEFDVKKDYRPGETARVTFTANQAGKYEFYCDEPGHREAGMVGVLTVS